jgi:Protein of unknown function (DUF2950)
VAVGVDDNYQRGKNPKTMWMPKRGTSCLRAAAVLAAAAALRIAAGYAGPQPRGESFRTPEDAAKALVAAAKADDVRGLLQILGPAARPILITGDPVADRTVRQKFAANAAERMRVVSDSKRPGWMVVEVGQSRWPTPIPLVRVNGAWRFDVDAGKHEILMRRIGDNELSAIEICRGYVEAQDEYADRERAAGKAPQFAQTFFSSPGRRDGLYWKSDDPEDQSPIAEIVAKAISEGYRTTGTPYHGYYFRILKEQGPHAPGGAKSYVDNGAMSRGFALIAWPSDYGSTGVMTFLVDKTGIVYQRDLGPQTTAVASAMTAYDPDEKWTPVPDSANP